MRSRIGAHPRNQVARPLAAEELQRHPLQVGIGLIAQVGRNPLADPGHDVGPGPSQQPGEDGCRGKPAQQPGNEIELGILESVFW